MRKLKLLSRLVLSATLFIGGSVSVLGQTLRWSSQGDALTLDPFSQNEILTNSINGQVYESLVAFDRQLDVAASLAESWERISPTHWRMKLRAGVKFHDGSAFTADDVVFSILRAKDPASGFRVFASALGEVRAISPLTVDFVQSQFNPLFLSHLALIRMMSKSWCEAHGAAKPQDYKNKEEKFTANHANGTGPFMLASRQPDVKTVYKRNPNWWGKFDGNVQEVIYTPIKSDASRTAALLSDSLDLVLDPSPQDVPKLRTSPGVKVLDGLENRVIYIGMDQGRNELLYSNVKGRNPFKDLRVRKALYMAVDIETLRSKLMRGQASPTGVMAPSPQSSFFDAGLEARLGFDLSVAKQLLAEAGFPDGFEVQLDCPNNRYVNDEEICVALAAMWAQIGVKVKVNAQPRALYFAKAEKLDVSMYLYGWGGGIVDMEPMMTPVLRNRGDGGVGYFNYGNYKNDKLDGLAAASSKEVDPSKREQLIKAALREEKEQVHHIPLHRQVIPWAMRSNVNAVHRADNWLEWRWVTVSAK